MRKAEIERKTKETDIKLTLNLDSTEVQINTGIGFFDHMLTAFAFHGGFSLLLDVKGDLEVDAHHTVEDVGICLGQAFKQALSDKKGIERFGEAFIPMDDALARCVLDISRPYLNYDVIYSQEKCGDFEICLVEEFFRALCMNAEITMHLAILYGSNAHHEAEALFKSSARALKQAIKITSNKMNSSKGVL
ncbi:MAG: imidazoleglycerol-phosphate dehydratase HisB [Clostridia bacterium]|nr:imidazoleglycerol-phosphate dehydratase HisB [Clostridia bacterium]